MLDKGIDWIIRNDQDYIMGDFMSNHIKHMPDFDEAFWHDDILKVYFTGDYNDKNCLIWLTYDNNFKFINMTIRLYDYDEVLLKVGRNETE
jgi:hypothetical protein